MTTREPNGPATPQDPTESWASAPTSELPAHPAAQPAEPPAQPAGEPVQAAAQPVQAAGQPVPEQAAHPAYATAGAGAPAGPPPQPAYATAAPGGPAGPAGSGGPAGPGGPASPPPYAAGPGGRRPNLWRRATSTTGGLVAVVVAGVLVVLLLIGAAGAAAFAVGRGLNHHGEARVGQVQPGRGNGMGPGMRGPGGRGPGEQQRQLGPQQRGLGGNGGGLGSALGGAAALGNVEHGEFTVTGSGGTPTVMTLQRGTVTAASATSLSVRSTDGFSATYALDSTTRTPGRTVANGDSVLVVAQKQGSKAVLVRLTR